MAIDYAEWAGSVTRFQAAPAEPQYKMIEQDQAWQQMKVWIRQECERAENKLESVQQALQHSGDYTHDGLIRAKMYVDIAKSEVLLFCNIEKKILSYTEEVQ